MRALSWTSSDERPGHQYSQSSATEFSSPSTGVLLLGAFRKGRYFCIRQEFRSYHKRDAITRPRCLLCFWRDVPASFAAIADQLLAAAHVFLGGGEKFAATQHKFSPANFNGPTANTPGRKGETKRYCFYGERQKQEKEEKKKDIKTQKSPRDPLKQRG